MLPKKETILREYILFSFVLKYQCMENTWFIEVVVKYIWVIKVGIKGT